MGIFAGALRTGRGAGLPAGGALDEKGFATLISNFGGTTISGFAGIGGGMGGAPAFGLATRLVLGAVADFGLDFLSYKNSTPTSGFSSTGGSDAGVGFDFGAVLGATAGSGFAAAFALASGLNPPIEASLATDFALARAGISRSDDCGAALALAVDFLGITGFGGSTSLVFSAGSLTTVTFVFIGRLRLIAAGLAFAGAEDFVTFAASGTFLTDRFFGDFAIFNAFTPGFARLPPARREGGFATVVFFGFFMATILAMSGVFASGD